MPVYLGLNYTNIDANTIRCDVCKDPIRGKDDRVSNDPCDHRRYFEDIVERATHSWSLSTSQNIRRHIRNVHLKLKDKHIYCQYCDFSSMKEVCVLHRILLSHRWLTFSQIEQNFHKHLEHHKPIVGRTLFCCPGCKIAWFTSR